MGNFATDKVGAGSILWSVTERPIVAPDGYMYWDVLDEKLYIRQFSAWVPVSGSINGLSGAVTLAAGTGITLTPTGNTITITATTGGTIGGSIAATQVAVGSGVNTIGGSAAFTAVANLVTINTANAGALALGSSGAQVNASTTNLVISPPGSGLISFHNSGLALGDFQWDGSTGFTSLLTQQTWRGLTSGSATIGVAAVAGTPNTLLLPTTTGTSGQVLSTNGANPQQLSWITPASTTSSAVLLTKRHSAMVNITGDGTAIITIQQIGENLAEVAAITQGQTDANRPPRKYYNGANTVVGGVSGLYHWWVGKNIATMYLVDLVRLTDERFWVALTDQTLAVQGASDNPAGNYAGFRFSTVAGDTHWQCITKNNTTQTVVDSGVTPVVTKTNRLAIVFNDAVPNVQFYIDGVLVATITTNLPTSGTSLGTVISTVTATDNTGAGIEFSDIYTEMDAHT